MFQKVSSNGKIVALVAEAQHDEALANQLIEHIFRPRIEAAKERLRAGQADGQLDPDIDLDLAIDLFYGGFYHRFLLRVAPLTHEHAKAVVDAVLAGIGGVRGVRLIVSFHGASPGPDRTRPSPDPVSHLLAADSVRPFRSCRAWCHRKDHHRWRPALARW